MGQDEGKRKTAGLSASSGQGVGTKVKNTSSHVGIRHSF
jgi:hypothetical protein